VSEIYDNILSEDALTILCANHLSKICPYGRMAKNSLFSSRPYGYPYVWVPLHPCLYIYVGNYWNFLKLKYLDMHKLKDGKMN